MSGLRWAMRATLLTLCITGVSSGREVFEYPCLLLDAYDTDGSCWRGMDVDGNWHGAGSQPGVPVWPQAWLVGPPPSQHSGVTLPADHWLHLVFAGPIIDGDGIDISLIESGMMGEQALVFLTDGADQEYVAALVAADTTGEERDTYIDVDLSTNPPPFVARGVRIVGTDLGGGSPGFDIMNVRARISYACGATARHPNPPSGAMGIDLDTQLGWTPACASYAQQIYLGPVESQVRSGSQDVRYSVQPPDANSFQPPHLRLGETYYWRVGRAVQEDANPQDVGEVWSFTVSDRFVVDDFESYFVYGGLTDVWEYSSWAGIFLEKLRTQTCEHAMNFSYYYDRTYVSEVFRRLQPPQDWVRMGARVLQLLLRGDGPDPASGQLYAVLTDGVHEQLVPYSGPRITYNDTDWYAWRIPLAEFTSIDLTRVRGIGVGIRPLTVPSGKSYRGLLSIADISLYPALCLDDRRPAGDLTGDCIVDYRDVKRMAADWLYAPVRTCEVAAPEMPVLWYTFDNHTGDSAGSAHGQVKNRVNFTPGVHGQAVRFSYEGDAVIIPDAASVFDNIREQITIAFWQYGDDSSHLNDTICCSNYEYGKSNPAISVNLGCWRNPGQYRWDCGHPWSIANRVAGHHKDKNEWTGRWNHWAFTKNARADSYGKTGRMEVYLNGVLYDSRSGTDSLITGITSFEIGTGWYGRYDGMIDDFRIYDYALSPAEVAWLATNGTGVVQYPVPSPADLDASDRVDFHDFAVLATQWLEDTLWP